MQTGPFPLGRYGWTGELISPTFVLLLQAFPIKTGLINGLAIEHFLLRRAHKYLM